MIRKSEAGDAWSGRDREDTSSPLQGWQFDQGDQLRFVGVTSDGPEGFVIGGDGVRLRTPAAAAFC